MFEWHKKEKPFFTGITRGVGGAGFGKTRAAGSSGPRFSATGGSTSTPGDGYKYHTFTSSGDFIITSGFDTVRVQALGGGAGGSSGNAHWATGGGGGGYAYASKLATPGTYPVTVGPGGSRQSSCGFAGNAGTPSTAFGFTGFGSPGTQPGNQPPTAPFGGGGFSIPGGTDLGSSNGSPGNGDTGDGSGGGGNNGRRVADPTFNGWGVGASGVPNFTPGPDASGYGNGGAGGHSCQSGHNGGGAGSPGIVVISYLV